MTVRNFARLGATSVLAVSALGLSAAPALAAAEVDFGVKAVGTTIAANASGKVGKITLSNEGTTKPDAVSVIFDATKLNMSKVKVSDQVGCEFEKGIALCTLVKATIPAAGVPLDLPIPLEKVAGASGSAGKLTITVQAKGDTNKGNDQATVDVSVGDNGADLAVQADDVTAADKNGWPTGKPVAPGTVGSLKISVLNHGDMTATGLKYEIKAPAQTTFEEIKGCSLSADKGTFTCSVDWDLIPKDKDTKEGDGLDSGVEVAVPVRVSPQAKGPVTLKGGTAKVNPIKQTVYSPSAKRKSKAALPEGLVPLSKAKVAAVDVDSSDNEDAFAVLVAAKAGGAGGGDTDGNGNGGPLPVTGPAGYALGGGGIAAVAVGVMMFVAARRRRVVLVTPGDEK